MEKAKGSPQHKFERRYLMAAPDVFRISDDEVMDEIKLSEYISKMMHSYRPDTRSCRMLTREDMRYSTCLKRKSGSLM